MKKKVISLILAATMVASLMVGCGSTNNTADTTEAPADDATEATEATEEITEAEVTEAATMEAP